MAEALHDIPALRRFAGLDAGESRVPDETTILLRDAEQTPHGDRGRVREEDDAGPRWFVPFKRMKGCDTTPEQKRLNRLLAAPRSAVEHPFRVLKRQFGYTKMRYRGLFKNEPHLFS